MREVDPLDLVETIREGLLVLDPDLTVRFANRSFCDTFAVASEDTIGRKLYDLGNGQWDIPELRSLIKTILPEQATIEAFEVDRVFPSIGRRVMVLNARKVSLRSIMARAAAPLRQASFRLTTLQAGYVASRGI